MFTHVYSCLLSLPMFTHVYLYLLSLPMFTYVYPCLLMFTKFTHVYKKITHVYLKINLHMFTHVYPYYPCLQAEGAMRELRDRYVYPVAENMDKYLVLNHATNGDIFVIIFSFIVSYTACSSSVASSHILKGSPSNSVGSFSAFFASRHSVVREATNFKPGKPFTNVAFRKRLRDANILSRHTFKPSSAATTVIRWILTRARQTFNNNQNNHVRVTSSYAFTYQLSYSHSIYSNTINHYN